MAIVTAPLLSLGARGQIAKTLVASTWKGLKTMRQYVKPANPQSTAQTVQRNLFSAAVDFWRTILTDTVQRTGWDKDASLGSSPMSGFNSFVANALGLTKTDPDGSMVSVITESTPTVIVATMKNADDGATGDEAGNFTIWAGLTPTNLSLEDTQAIAAGACSFDIGETFQDVEAFYQVRKGSQNRSGIFAATVTSS